MASITIVLRDPVTGAGLPNQAVKLRVGPGFGLDTYTMADVAGKAGSYKISDVLTGVYKLFVNGTVDNSFGGDDGREIFRSDDILLKSGGTMAGVIDMNNNRMRNLPAPVNNDEPARITELSAQVALLLPKTGGTMTGLLDMDGQHITGLPDIPSTVTGPVNWRVFLSYIAGIIATPFQLGVRSRRVIASGSEVAGRDYLTIQTALNSITSLSADERYSIYLQEGSSNNTNNAHLDNVFFVTEQNLKSHLSLIGNGLNTVLILNTNVSGLTKINLIFENMIIYMGSNEFSSARAYNGLSFKNCTVYSYNSTTYNNCNGYNTLFINANGFSPTLSGTGIYLNCGFAQSIIESSFTGTRPNTQDGFLTNPTMPIDPTIII